jgi:putative ABC transport system substrate-binding protein
MRRREFITILGGPTLAETHIVRAIAQQPDRVRLIGVLISITKTDSQIPPRLAAFENELRKLGWDVGRSVRIEYRFGEGDTNRMRMHAADLVAMKPDVIFASGTPTVSALQRATSDIPIVFAVVDDPVGSVWTKSSGEPSRASCR